MSNLDLFEQPYILKHDPNYDQLGTHKKKECGLESKSRIKLIILRHGV